jgi:phosphatidylserine synthase
MPKPPKNVLVRNAANIVSILGVLPLCILFCDFGYQYLIPLIIYNNVMDDLDGVLAIKLDIKSRFGAMLDNVCDTISHSIFVFVVGTHYLESTDDVILGGMCVAGALLATIAIIVRSVSRLDPDSPSGTGSPTNELIRHMLLAILVSQLFKFDPTPLLIVAFLMHSVTMLVPYRMPYLIRSLTKSATAIGLVNVALVLAWLVPYSAPIIAAAFVGTYFYSLLTEGFGWFTRLDAGGSP